MARSRAARRGRGPKNNVWTVVASMNDSVAGAATETLRIATEADWSGASAASMRHATLLRIRGWLSVVNDAAADGAFAWYISVGDQDLTPPAATAAATYGDMDVIMSGGGQFEASTLGDPQPFTVDVKAMRRFTSNDDIFFTISSSTAGASIKFSTVLRALIRVGGN